MFKNIVLTNLEYPDLEVLAQLAIDFITEIIEDGIEKIKTVARKIICTGIDAAAEVLEVCVDFFIEPFFGEEEFIQPLAFCYGHSDDCNPNEKPI